MICPKDLEEVDLSDPVAISEKQGGESCHVTFGGVDV